MDQPRIDYHFEEKVKMYKATLTADLYKDANKNASAFINLFKEVKQEEENDHPDILLKDILK